MPGPQILLAVIGLLAAYAVVLSFFYFVHGPKVLIVRDPASPNAPARSALKDAVVALDALKKAGKGDCPQARSLRHRIAELKG